jgi:5-methylcytosine-specific restriction enzyme A
MPARSKRPYAQTSEQRRESAKRYDESRSDEIRRLYSGRAWRIIAQLIIARDPICKDCGQEASTLADHVIPARKYIAMHNGDLTAFYDETNLQGLGTECHAKKSAAERRGMGVVPQKSMVRATATKLSACVSNSPISNV